MRHKGKECIVAGCTNVVVGRKMMCINCNASYLYHIRRCKEQGAMRHMRAYAQRATTMYNRSKGFAEEMELNI